MAVGVEAELTRVRQPFYISLRLGLKDKIVVVFE